MHGCILCVIISWFRMYPIKHDQMFNTIHTVCLTKLKMHGQTDARLFFFCSYQNTRMHNICFVLCLHLDIFTDLHYLAIKHVVHLFCAVWFKTTRLFLHQQKVRRTKTQVCCKMNDAVSVRKSAIWYNNLYMHWAHVACTNVTCEGVPYMIVGINVVIRYELQQHWNTHKWGKENPQCFNTVFTNGYVHLDNILYNTQASWKLKISWENMTDQ